MGCTAAKPAAPKKAQPNAAQLPPKVVEPAEPLEPVVSSPLPTETRPTLRYLDVWGRGEVLRMTLHFAGVSFLDQRMTKEEWAAFKPRAEFNVCPIMDIDGKTLSQARAILRYICYKKGFYPANKEQTYLCESVCDLVEDMRSPLLQAYLEEDKEKIAKAKEPLPGQLLMLETRLLKSPDQGKSYFLGKYPSMCDFMVFNFLWDNYMCKERNLQAEVPKTLQSFTTKMLENPGLSAYVRGRETRPY